MPDSEIHPNLWGAKLAAWTHDPAEKALVLLRDPTGHEWGTVADLREQIFGQRSIPSQFKDIIEKADHWAAAADRPQWPRDESDGRFAPWTQVRFTKRPVLIHPLSGMQFELDRLSDIGVEDIKTVSKNHFLGLLDADGDAKKTALAFWRFGPILQQESELKTLWGVLPADTRVPDHTIWQHLDLTSAFATAFHGDKDNNPALLTFSFGPVQEFIAQARTTSDLWAGSHLLSRIAWEGIKVICDNYGPDAVIFPQLRGIPQVDLWLKNEIGLPECWFSNEEWKKGATDSNPLFAAALPNRVVALIPESATAELMDHIAHSVRDWVMEIGKKALNKLLARTNMPDSQTAREQIEEQLYNFPEIHWAIAPWHPLIDSHDCPPKVARLKEVLKTFQGDETSQHFFKSGVWQLLSRELTVDNQRFYTPNAGVLYPPLYDLLDRSHAASKSARIFKQLPQEGYRCSLCGEREWLTHDRELLQLPPGKRGDRGSLWESGNLQGTSWARKGEHLCALCTLKRLWPNLYSEEIHDALGVNVSRFVVSTHTMALATSLEHWLERGGRDSLPQDWLCQLQSLHADKRVALPRKLAKHLNNEDDEEIHVVLRGLPLFLENLQEESQSDESDEQNKAAESKGRLENKLKEIFGNKPETYYAMVLMDGDRMGAWLSGQGEEGERYRLPFKRGWHPQLRITLENRHRGRDLEQYLNEKRPVSPARHIAISNSLNEFALHIARYFIEDVGKGKLIYAGGDDVLAMVSVDDLLAVMFLLRLAYSGIFPQKQFEENAKKIFHLTTEQFEMRNGYIKLGDRLHRMMGHLATASVGAVVAHHQAPLGSVLRKLRETEQRAKKQGNRDAFAISLLKRSGGAVHLTCPWLAHQPGIERDWQEAMESNLLETPMGQLIRLRDHFADSKFSRRAAYITQGWLADVPESALSTMLGHQFRQQTQGEEDKESAQSIGEAVGKLATSIDARAKDTGKGTAHGQSKFQPQHFVENFLSVAEFLAREGRTRGAHTRDE